MVENKSIQKKIEKIFNNLKLNPINIMSKKLSVIKDAIIVSITS